MEQRAAGEAAEVVRLDVGAYEQAERLPPPVLVPALGVEGMAALAVLLAATALLLVRRRRAAA